MKIGILKKIIAIIFFCSAVIDATAQSFITDFEFENFDYNVKQIEEFMQRFNLNKILIQPTQSKEYIRLNRALLFDKNYYQTHSDSINEFLDAAESQNTILNFQDTSWYAIAECNVLFNGTKDSLILTLRTEQITHGIYKWSIVDATGKILQLSPEAKPNKVFILPTDNEVNFLSLKSVTTTNSRNVTLFSLNKYKNNELNVFNTLVYYKLLKIENVKRLTFCFNSVDGYKFYVKKFIRDEKNAGWLIYNITKVPQCDHINNEKVMTSTQLLEQFYARLTKYSQSPQNITLARSIKDMFLQEAGEPYIIGEKHICDDINDYSTTLSITEYLHSIEQLHDKGITNSYSISNLDIKNITGDSVVAIYNVTIKNNNFNTTNYTAKTLIKNGLLVNIIPHYENQ